VEGEENEKPKSDHDVRSVAESDITTASDVSVAEESTAVMNSCELDDIAVSDVDEVGDGDFSQWTDSMDALIASFDVTSKKPPASDDRKTALILESPVTTPLHSRVAMSTGSSESPSAAKRHLETSFDALQEPPVNRQRQAVTSVVPNELSPLRKTLASSLSLRTP